MLGHSTCKDCKELEKRIKQLEFAFQHICIDVDILKGAPFAASAVQRAPEVAKKGPLVNVASPLQERKPAHIVTASAKAKKLKKLEKKAKRNKIVNTKRSLKKKMDIATTMLNECVAMIPDIEDSALEPDDERKGALEKELNRKLCIVAQAIGQCRDNQSFIDAHPLVAWPKLDTSTWDHAVPAILALADDFISLSGTTNDEPNSWKILPKDKRLIPWIRPGMVIGKDAAPISLDNIGSIILQKKGWIPGSPLGDTMQGALEPLTIIVLKHRSGVGAPQTKKEAKMAKTLGDIENVKLPVNVSSE